MPVNYQRIYMESYAKLFFAANLSLIVVSLFGCIIKWFYRPRAYKEHFAQLFPGQFYVGLLFLLQILELPYLFDMADIKSLRYANAFSMLLSPPLMIIICQKFFFPRDTFRYKGTYLFLPALAFLIIFLLRSVGILTFSEIGRNTVIYSAVVMFAWFFYLTIRIALRIGRVIKQIEVFEFSDTQDYTKTFAGYVQWLPTTLCILSLTTYLCNNPWVKFGYDILCIIFTVGFVIFTLDPWREVDFVENKEIVENISQGNTEKSKWRMSESRYLALKGNLMELFENKHIYLTPHLTLDMLLKELSTNRNYLCETIARSGFKSFYDIVNSYRITHAINLIETEPEAKMIDIAIRSGFASAASMNKAFTQQGQPSPSKFRTSNA